jgi:hypothetical protein
MRITAAQVEAIPGIRPKRSHILANPLACNSESLIQMYLTNSGTVSEEFSVGWLAKRSSYSHSQWDKTLLQLSFFTPAIDKALMIVMIRMVMSVYNIRSSGFLRTGTVLIVDMG